MIADVEAYEVLEGARKFARDLNESKNSIDIAVAQAILRLANIAERLLVDSAGSSDDLQGQLAILSVRNAALEEYVSKLEKLPYDTHELQQLTSEVVEALKANPSELGANVVRALIQQDATLAAQKQVLEDQRVLLRNTSQREGNLQSRLWRASSALRRGDLEEAQKILSAPLENDISRR